MTRKASLWRNDDAQAWRRAFDSYESVVAEQGVASLAGHDDWYRDVLPGSIAARAVPHVTLPDLVRATEWKMSRGVWRAPNLVRVRNNDAQLVIDITSQAFALCPHPTKPIKEIATLDGVGPATASAVAAAYMPSVYPFFDELVAAQIPSLGAVAWTPGYYAKYAEALRERASALGDGWSCVMLERALWAHIGGKAGV
jgi:hypothetical protein